MKVFQEKRDFFALVFSDHRLQLGQADKKGRLKIFQEKKLEPGIIERGEINKKKALAATVQALLKAAGIKKKFVVVGLPEVKAFTRAFTLPSLSNEELNDAVRWESEPLLPFPLAKAYLDWMVLERTPDWVRVLVVALPQDLVEDYACLLESLGYQPIAFEITSLCLARLVRKKGTAVLAINVKASEAVLVIVGPQGGIEVSSTVSFKNEKEAGEEIILTLKHILSFYRKRVGEKRNGRKIVKVILCGEGARKELARKVKNELGLPTALLKSKFPERIVMTSLAGKNTAAPANEATINLIPPRIQGLYDRAARVNQISNWFKISLLFLFFIFFSYGVATARVYFGIKKIEGQIIQLQASVKPETRELEARAQEINQRARHVNSIVESEKEIGPLWAVIREAAPAEVVVTSYSYDGVKDVFFVDGFAPSREKLLAFRESLEKTGKFYRVQIPLSSLEKENNIDFTLYLIIQKEGQ